MNNHSRKIILLDIDHTVRNSFWRDPMIGSQPWDEYHKAGMKDKPYEDMVRLVQDLSLRGWSIVAVTAINEKWRQATMRYLLEHDVWVDTILMRPDDDYRTSSIVKVDLAKRHICGTTDPNVSLKDHVAFVIDDRDDVCTAFRAEGVAVLHVHQRRD